MRILISFVIAVSMSSSISVAAKIKLEEKTNSNVRVSEHLPNEQFESYALSPNRKYAVRVYKGRLEITDQSLRKVLSCALNAPVEHLSSVQFNLENSKKIFWTSDSKYLYFCSSGRFHRFSVKTKKTETLEIPRQRVYFCAYSPKSNVIAVACRSSGERYDNWTVTLVDSNKFKLLPNSTEVLGLYELVWNSSGEKLAILSIADYWSHLYLTDKRLNKISDLWAVDLFKIKWSPDNKFIAGVYKNNWLKIFSLETLLPIQEIQNSAKIRSFSWSQDGKTLSVLSENDKTATRAIPLDWNFDKDSPAVTLSPPSCLKSDDNFFPKSPEEVYRILDQNFGSFEKSQLVTCFYAGQLKSVVDSHKFDERIKTAACMTTEWGKDYGPIGTYYNSLLKTRSKSKIIADIIYGYSKYLAVQ